MGEDFKPYGKPTPLRIDEQTDIMLTAVSQLTGEKKAIIMRRYITEGVKAELMMKFGIMDEVLKLVRTAVNETSKPYTERMAKIASKNTIAAYTSLFLNQEVIGQLGRKDVRDLTEMARKKAIAALAAKDKVEEPDVEGDING